MYLLLYESALYQEKENTQLSLSLCWGGAEPNALHVESSGSISSTFRSAWERVLSETLENYCWQYWGRWTKAAVLPLALVGEPESKCQWCNDTWCDDINSTYFQVQTILKSANKKKVRVGRKPKTKQNSAMMCSLRNRDSALLCHITIMLPSGLDSMRPVIPRRLVMTPILRTSALS